MNNCELSSKLKQKASEYGFVCHKLLPLELFSSSKYAEIPSEAKSLFVAFMPYHPAKKSEYGNGKIALSGYYPVSNKAYRLIKELMTFLKSNGIFCIENKAVYEKDAASYCGGSFGKNTLYYIKEYGSFVFIATFFTGLKPDKEQFLPAKLSEICKNCNICSSVCPVSALPKRDMKEDCMRAMMFKKPLNKLAYGNIYQLLGCEICQKSCPLNVSLGIAEEKGIEFDIKKLFHDRTELENIVGKNYARKQTVLQQLIAYSADNDFFGIDEEIEALKTDKNMNLSVVIEYYENKRLMN